MTALFLILHWLVSLMPTAEALPLYAQRSGRSCANCHVSPTLEDEEGWENPELLDRKCTMSCVGCHTDPTGGGTRTASGRYYARSTLAIIHSEDRDYADHGRELLSSEALWRFQQRLRKPLPEGRNIPSDEEEAKAGIGEGRTAPWQAFGDPAGGHDRMALWDGRYGALNGDPAFHIGADARVAWWSGSNTVFPMQAELHGTWHPVHKVSAVATAAARGRTVGLVDPQVPVYPRRAFLMLHELPGMSWAKAGIFQPAFGTYTTDHTSPVRSLFEQDLRGPDDLVAGVEVGTAPNYPFATASFFANDTSLFTGATPDRGWGATLHGGWRDLAWSITGHAQVRRRQQELPGDLAAAGLTFGLNPAARGPLPVTWTGEVTGGQRVVGQVTTWPVAAMSELSIRPWNGVILSLKDDAIYEAGFQHRHGAGVQITPVPGISVEGIGRAVLNPGSAVGYDALVQTHLWF